jgi:hypothetical protein
MTNFFRAAPADRNQAGKRFPSHGGSILMAFFLTVFSAGAEPPKPVVSVNFEESAGSLDQQAVTGENKGSSGNQLEIKEPPQAVGDDLPIFVAGSEEKGAAVQFKGKVGIVGQIAEVPLPQTGFSFSVSFKTDVGQGDFARVVECVKLDGTPYLGMGFVRPQGADENTKAGELYFDCNAGPGGRIFSKTDVTDGQWHTATISFDPQGGPASTGKFTALLDGKEVGVIAGTTEQITSPEAINIFIGAEAAAYRPFAGSIDDISLTSE